MTMPADFVERGGFAETGDIGVFRSPFDMLRTNGLFSAPKMIHAPDAPNFLVSQLAVGAVNELSELAGVDEKRFAAAIAEPVIFLLAGEDPHNRGDLGRVKKLAR